VNPDKFFQQPCDFVYASQKPDQLPKERLPEVAFAGRSNVGKSSLLNALVRRKSLARTSNTPGRTQQINFFDLANKLTLVDLPGYGYAKVSKDQRNLWEKLMSKYFESRGTLKRVCLLIDARHPVKPSDREMMEFLDTFAVPYVCVLTKSDAAKVKELEKNVAILRDVLSDHPAAFPDLLMTSSRKKKGLTDLRKHIQDLVVS